MKEKTLAIFSPNQNAYSETFIQAHKRLPFTIKFYCNGYLPTYLENRYMLDNFSRKERIAKKIFKKFSLQEYGLYYSLKRENVGCVLAEYGPTACESLDVIKALNLPLIVHFHGFDASANSILDKYSKQYEAVFDYASAVIAVSGQMKAKLEEFGCSPDKLLLSTYGPDPAYFNIQPLYTKQQFVAVGRFVEKKSPHLTILAFAKIANQFSEARLIMIGEGVLLSTCKDLVDVLGLTAKVEFKGALPPEEIRKIFEDSIAFLQHSVVAEDGDSEGTPVAILEAQAAALPVIATYHAGIPDVVIHNETGFLVQEKDVAGMAFYICQLLNNTVLAKKMGCAARKRIREFFTMEKHLNKLADKIREIMP